MPGAPDANRADNQRIEGCSIRRRFFEMCYEQDKIGRGRTVVSSLLGCEPLRERRRSKVTFLTGVWLGRQGQRSSILTYIAAGTCLLM